MKDGVGFAEMLNSSKMSFFQNSPVNVDDEISLLVSGQHLQFLMLRLDWLASN